MHLIDLHLNDNLEVEERLRRHRGPSRKEADYPGFPYIFYTIDFASYMEDRIPWHWHHDLEIVEVTSGTIEIRSGRTSYILNEGDLCFINTNIMHQLSPQPDSHCVLETQFFQAELISGGWQNAFDTRYVSPVLDCRDLDLFPFSSHNEQTAVLRQLLREAREICQAKAFGYEFDVRGRMTEVWKILFQAVQPRLQQRRTLDDRSEERMRVMLSFIQKNHGRKMELAEIAEAATISERECFRCFQKTLGVTPIHYLQNYRIRMAARRLLETDDTVLAISQAVGFSDNSYFGRIFQKYMHCTPTQYRRKHQN